LAPRSWSSRGDGEDEGVVREIPADEVGLRRSRRGESPSHRGLELGRAEEGHVAVAADVAIGEVRASRTHAFGSHVLDDQRDGSSADEVREILEEPRPRVDRDVMEDVAQDEDIRY